MDKETIRTLAETAPPPAKKWKFTFARQAQAEIARLENELGLEPSAKNFNLGMANSKIEKLQALLAAKAAGANATTPLVSPVAETAVLSLKTLRDLERAVFGSNSIGTFGGDETKQKAALTKKFYQQNLVVPGLDYSALQSAGIFRETIFGRARTIRAFNQEMVEKFFEGAKKSSASPPLDPNLRGAARFRAAVKIEGQRLS